MSFNHQIIEKLDEMGFFKTKKNLSDMMLPKLPIGLGRVENLNISMFS